METRDICVVGGGVSGLAALRIISETPQFKSGIWRVTAYESREDLGGVWFPAPPTDDPPLTPLYDSLTTNLPHPVMGFPDFPFPPSTPLYPRAYVVQQYLKDYAAHFSLYRLIEFSTAVEDAQWLVERSKWKITVSTAGVHSLREFDLMVVANGHYRLPRKPETPGLSAWISRGKASHAAWYRRPTIQGGIVLVIGGGPSGQDVAHDMRLVPNTTVVHSITDATACDEFNLKIRGRVSRFGDVDSGEIVFESGETIQGIECCILATGYQTWFPFLNEDTMRRALPPIDIQALPEELYDSSYHVFPLSRHLFSLHQTFPASALAFLGLPIRVAPFPLVEAQARAVVSVLADPSRSSFLKEKTLVLDHYRNMRERRGINSPLEMAKAWPRFEEDTQWRYRDELHELAGVSDSVPHGVVPEWVKEIYTQKDALRAKWRDLERTGEADDYVRGVGEAARDWREAEREWLKIMKKLLATQDGDADDLEGSGNTHPI